MRFVTKIIVLFLISLSGMSIVHAQQGQIRVVDGKTGEPVVFAHVCFQDLKTGNQKHSITDDKGIVLNTCPGLAQVAISYVGYKTLFDTLAAKQNQIIQLTPTILNMDEVVVTAQYTPEKADKSIYPIKVLTSKQIEYKAANNLTDLMRSELNMRTSQDGVLGASISLQGLSGENVKLLVDGVPVIGRMNGNIDLSQINLNNVDHVEVIEGPMSVVYGSNALAGVINLITRENKNTRFMADLNSYVESVGVYNFDAALSAKKKNHVLMVNGGRNFFGGYSDPDTSRAKLWKPKRQIFGNADYLYSRKNLKLKFSNQYFNELLQNKGNLIPPYFEKAFDSYFYTDRFVSRLDVASPLGENRFLNALVSWSWFERRKQTYFKDLTTLDEVMTTNSGDQDTTVFNAWVGRITYSKSNKSSTLNYQVGIDANLEEGSGKRITGNVQQIGDYAAFISMKLEPFAGLVIQPGGRVSYNSRYAAPLVYSLNLKWAPLENYTFRASYSRGFRAPSLKELYLMFVDVNHNVRGNEDLKAEYSHNFNFSAGYNHEKGHHVYSADLACFYNKIDNIISLANVESNLYSYINIDKFNSMGAQLNLVYRYYPALSLKAGVSHTGRKNELLTSGVQPAFKYSTDFVFESSYTWLKSGLTLSAFYKYTGRLPQFYTASDGSLVEGFISDFNNLDVSAVKSLWKNRISITAGARNIFDIKSVDAMGGNGGAHTGDGSGSVPVGWGRSYFIKFALHLYQFEKENVK